MELRGKVALITGASSGFGRSMAGIMAQAGAAIVLVARNGAALDEAVAEISAKGGEAIAAIADVGDRAALDAAVASALARFGRIDILVNNAGVGYFGPIETMSPADFDRVLRTNLYGLVNATQAAMAALKQSRGMIVNVSSGLSHRALPFLAAYAGTKAMVNALSDGLRLEVAPYGIRVLTYCPPAADSGFNERSIKGAGMSMRAGGGMRMATTEGVAARMVAAIRAEKRQSGSAGFRAMSFFMPRLMDRMFSGMVRQYGPPGP
jgi:NAD(P)-dependent dehydrogenase (short-subunit alcohol dehydrogenase family)